MKSTKIFFLQLRQLLHIYWDIFYAIRGIRSCHHLIDGYS